MNTPRPCAPRVTVLLPVHDAERYLAEAVESILAQSFGDFELLAIDDGSRDGSAAILDAYARRDARVRVVRRPHEGLIATLNEGLALARGELVARMDADDVALPQRLERQAERLDRDPGLLCIGGAFEVIDAGLRPFDACVFRDHPAALCRCIGGPPCAAMYRRRRDRVGAYDASAPLPGLPLAPPRGSGP
jgi:glycosyltransferase involved in cell wall biosynthesis